MASCDSPGSPLAHLTTLTSCLSPSSLRLVRRAAAESGCAWSCPAFTTSGSMDSRMLRKTSCEWNVRPKLGDEFWISSIVPELDGIDEARVSSSATFSWPIFFSLRAKRERVVHLWSVLKKWRSRTYFRCWSLLVLGPRTSPGNSTASVVYNIKRNHRIIHWPKEQLLKNYNCSLSKGSIAH